MDLGLAGARVLVTGGGSNVGRGIVHGFAAEGARVAVCDQDGAQAQLVVGEARQRGAAAALAIVADLTLESAPARVVEQLVGDWGGVDVLVNNAGWSVPGFLQEHTDRAQWQRLVEVNLFATIACTQAVLPAMRAAGSGAIVFISSDAAFGVIRQAVYGATKAGIIALARTTAREHGRHGIRSNVVCPGLVLPESSAAVGEGSLWAAGADAIFDERQIESVRAATPLRRLTTAADVAAAVVWLSSEPAARQVTGQVLAVGGGSAMP